MIENPGRFASGGDPVLLVLPKNVHCDGIFTVIIDFLLPSSLEADVVGLGLAIKLIMRISKVRFPKMWNDL